MEYQRSGHRRCGRVADLSEGLEDCSAKTGDRADDRNEIRASTGRLIEVGHARTSGTGRMEYEPCTAGVEEPASIVAGGVHRSSEVYRSRPGIGDRAARRHPQILAAESTRAGRSQ